MVRVVEPSVNTKAWGVRQGARMLRLAVVKNLLGQGQLNAGDAQELLSGCLTPDNESSRIDDSSLLSLTFDEAVEATKDGQP